MKTITVRGIDPEVDKKLKETAKEQGKSRNQLILEMIRKNLGIERERKYSHEYNDLDALFGKWTEDEFRRISGKIDCERTVDQELWQ